MHYNLLHEFEIKITNFIFLHLVIIKIILIIFLASFIVLGYNKKK
jgi:hypothetical protein